MQGAFFRNMGGNDLSDTYKICFLGYKKLGELAHQVIEHLNYSDTTIILKECSIETLVQAVNEAISEGCQVFVAGSANAEEFKRRFYEHLIELHIDMSDYLYCLQRAKELGAKKIAVTVHRKSRKVDFDVLQSLTKIPIHTIYYQSETELEYNLSHTDCDCVIGAALANEIAERLGLKGILIYEGEYTIRSSIDQARNLAAELQSASRKESITNAIIRNVPAGIIITDENGRITTFNKQAKKLTGFQEQKLRGQFLSDVIPSLSYAAFYKSGQIQSDRKHLFDGAMVRCIQTRLLQGDQQIGMLTTLQEDNSRRKKMDSTREFFAHHQWKDVLGTSSVIRRVVAEGKTLAEMEDPVALIGENGTGKSFFAQCIHNGSPRRRHHCLAGLGRRLRSVFLLSATGASSALLFRRGRRNHDTFQRAAFSAGNTGGAPPDSPGPVGPALCFFLESAASKGPAGGCIHPVPLLSAARVHSDAAPDAEGAGGNFVLLLLAR